MCLKWDADHTPLVFCNDLFVFIGNAMGKESDAIKPLIW